MVGHEFDSSRRPGHGRADAPRGARGRRSSGSTATAARPPSRTSPSRSARGEIVAVAGVSGNGQRELAEAITGLRPPSSGSIHVGGRRLHGAAIPARAFAAGIAYVPEDRLGTGVTPSFVDRGSISRSSRTATTRSGHCCACVEWDEHADEMIRRVRHQGAPRKEHRGLSPVRRESSEARARAGVLRRPEAADRRVGQRAASTSTRSRRCTAYLIEAAEHGVARTADQRGPRRGARSQRPYRRHVRGTNLGSPGSGSSVEEIGLLMAGEGRRTGLRIRARPACRSGRRAPAPRSSGSVMIASPAPFEEADRCADLRRHAALAELALREVRLRVGERHPVERPLGGLPVVEGDLLHRGGNHEQLRVERVASSERRGPCR